MLFCLVALTLGLAACGEDDAQRPPPTPTPSATPPPASTGQDEPPARDPLDLARRLRGLSDPPTSVSRPPPAEGDREEFVVLQLPASEEEPPERRTVVATLRAASEHAYFFVEAGAEVPDGEVEQAARVFEEEVWPQVTAAFGLPAIPGVDGDPRVVILHADMGEAVAGYVSGDDAYPRAAAPLSNQRELVYLHTSLRPLGGPLYARVLAHELQHVIHVQHDPDEEAWVNEGLSEAAAGLVGEGRERYGAFLDRPDTQLNAWGRGEEEGAHYAASALFFAYLLEQAGGDPRELAAEPADGIAGVEAFLGGHSLPRSFEELVADWAVGNYLDEPDGPYGYREREVGPPETVPIEEAAQGEGEVHQFAADYLELDAETVGGASVFAFAGEQEVAVLPVQPFSGHALWWANRGDNIDARLTRELDLAGVERATLTFRTWFDIERWFDYGYVEVSSDGGRTWQVLSGRQTTTDDPLGVSYGPAYTGRSGGGETPQWVEERIDLTPYAGREVLLRFEYLTDDAMSEPGWAIDDIAVPEIGFFDGAESDLPVPARPAGGRQAGVSGWHREGFRRIDGPLPQHFQLRLIKLGPAPQVETIPLDAGNRAEVRLTGLGTEYQTAVIVVVATTEGTTEPARYRYEVWGLEARRGKREAGSP